MLGKIEGRKRSRWERRWWLNGITDSVDMNLSKFWEILEDREPGRVQFMRSQRVGHNSATEQHHLCITKHSWDVCTIKVNLLGLKGNWKLSHHCELIEEIKAYFLTSHQFCWSEWQTSFNLEKESEDPDTHLPITLPPKVSLLWLLTSLKCWLVFIMYGVLSFLSSFIHPCPRNSLKVQSKTQNQLSFLRVSRVLNIYYEYYIN